MTTLITKDNLAANTITAEKISSAVALGGPKISSLDYPGDDTAALPTGGQTVTISGTGFVSGATVYLDGAVVSPVTFNNANSISFTTPAKSANSYVLYVINPDGATAIAIPGLTYSGVPTWTTSAGSLGAPYEANSFSVTLQATSDSNVTFSMSAGNTLPTGLSLAANGLISGTIPATEANTTYTFYVDAIDAQNQETSRTFSVTYTRDTVTWSSPANGAAYAWDMSVANTFTMTANSASGKSITYTVQSGSLPANVSISGANVAGTPNSVQTNTSVVIRATAAGTNRFADRTLYFVINEPAPSTIGQFYRGGYYAGQIYNDNSGIQYYLIVAPKSGGESFKQLRNQSINDTPIGTSRTPSPLYYDGYAATFNNNNSGWPAFQWARGLTINGYSDWYIPSIMEFDIIAYWLGPGGGSNYSDWFVQSYAGFGVNNRNPYTRVPSVATLQNSTYYGTTSVAAFQSSGSEKFDNEGYWTSTKEDSTAFGIYFNLGRLNGTPADQGLKVRAIRRVPV